MAVEIHVEDHPSPLYIVVLEAQVRREASVAIGLGDEVDLTILVRNAGTVVAGISGWTWGNCCELQNLWVKPSLRRRGLGTRLIALAEAKAANRGCSRPSTSPTLSRLELCTSGTASAVRPGGVARGLSVSGSRQDPGFFLLGQGHHVKIATHARQDQPSRGTRLKGFSAGGRRMRPESGGSDRVTLA